MKLKNIKTFEQHSSELSISDVMNSILSELEKESKLSLEKSKEYESESFEDSRWFDGNSSGINYTINLIKSKLN